jgi:hypothetical protein
VQGNLQPAWTLPWMAAMVATTVYECWQRTCAIKCATHFLLLEANLLVYQYAQSLLQ